MTGSNLQPLLEDILVAQILTLTFQLQAEKASKGLPLNEGASLEEAITMIKLKKSAILDQL